MIDRTRKVMMSLLVVAVLGGLAAFGVFAAFSATTTNPGNSFSAGTVAISDNDAGVALYSVSNAKPGTTNTSCIQVTYTGSLDADVKLYTADAIGAIGPYVNLTIDTGTGGNAACTGFVPDGGPSLFNGTLAGFRAAHSSYATGLLDYPGVATKWVAANVVTYRYTVTLQDVQAAAGTSSGVHAFTWEAQNQ